MKPENDKDILAAHLTSEPDARTDFNEGLPQWLVIGELKQFFTQYQNPVCRPLSEALVKLLDDAYQLDFAISNATLSKDSTFGLLDSQKRKSLIEECKKRCLLLATGIMKIWQEKGEVLIPGGWIDELGNHAMAYRLANVDAENVILEIYNTGSGLDHHERSDTWIEKYARKMAFTITTHNQIPQITQLLADLLVHRLATGDLLHWMTNSHERNPNNGFAIYNIVLNKLAMFEKAALIQNKDDNLRGHSKSQRANSCAAHVYLRVIRERVQEEYYPQVHFDIKAYYLKYLQLRIPEVTNVDYKNKIYQQCERAKADLARFVHKHRLLTPRHLEVLQLPPKDSPIQVDSLRQTELLLTQMANTVYKPNPSLLIQQLKTGLPESGSASTPKVKTPVTIELNKVSVLDNLKIIINYINDDFYSVDEHSLLRTIESFILDLDLTNAINSVTIELKESRDILLEQWHTLFYAYLSVATQLKFMQLPRTQVVLETISCLIVHVFAQFDYLKSIPKQSLGFRTDNEFKAYWFWDTDNRVNSRAHELVEHFGNQNDNSEEGMVYNASTLHTIFLTIFRNLPADAKDILEKLYHESSKKRERLYEKKVLSLQQDLRLKDICHNFLALFTMAKVADIPFHNQGIATFFLQLQQALAIFLIVGRNWRKDHSGQLMIVKDLPWAEHIKWNTSARSTFYGKDFVVLPYSLFLVLWHKNC